MMLSRALALATVTLLIGCCTMGPTQAQENLDAGKSPSAIFANTCTACHKSPRGLLKTVAPGALPGFLREHYTTGPDMAGVLSSYLISNGAVDTRYDRTPKGERQPKSAHTAASSHEQPGLFGRLFHPGVAAPQGAEPQPEQGTSAAANRRARRAHSARRAHPAKPAEHVHEQADGKEAPSGASTATSKPESGKPATDGSAAAAKPAAAASAASDAAGK